MSLERIEARDRGERLQALPEEVADLRAAGRLALEALDNIMSAHDGQQEQAQMLAAFNALSAALR